MGKRHERQCVCICIFFLSLTLKIWMRCYCRPSWIAKDKKKNDLSFHHLTSWPASSCQSSWNEVSRSDYKQLYQAKLFFFWFWCRKPEVSKLGTIILQISGLAYILGSVRSCNEQEVFTHNKDELIWLVLPGPTSQRPQAWWCQFERDSERTNPGADMLTLMLTRGHLQPHQTAVLGPDFVF